jgi:hypothetical protein
MKQHNKSWHELNIAAKQRHHNLFAWSSICEGNLTMDYFENITTTPSGGAFAVADTGAADITNRATAHQS